jgi:hypothetical protein
MEHSSAVRWSNKGGAVTRQNSDLRLDQVDEAGNLFFDGPLYKHGFMQCLLSLCLWLLAFLFPPRFASGNLALRQQLAVLKVRHPQPRFAAFDKLFWVMLRRLWPGWKQALILVQPETVVGWHHAGFKLYWKWLSRHRTRVGRRCASKELRELIFRMVAENPTSGAPRIHGGLRMLGSERTVSRWMRKDSMSPKLAKRWAAFLDNHREAIAAMDFFTVPTLTFGVLHCFFVIAHDRRRILHCNVTRHPSSLWITQQLREAFPYDAASNYLIFDRAANFNEEVIGTVKSFGITPKQTNFRSPWQSGVAERRVGNCRRDLLDHVIVLNVRYLQG